MDTILQHGDTLYTSIAEDDRYLNFEDIPQSSASVSESIHGIVNGTSETPFYSLDDAVNALLKNHVMAGCVLTMGHAVQSYSCAIIKSDSTYYFFDAHSRSDVGMVDPEGEACLTEHKDVFHLCSFIRHLAASLKMKGHIPFELATIRFLMSDHSDVMNLEMCSDTDTNSSSSFFNQYLMLNTVVNFF